MASLQLRALKFSQDRMFPTQFQFIRPVWALSSLKSVCNSLIRSLLTSAFTAHCCNFQPWHHLRTQQNICPRRLSTAAQELPRSYRDCIRKRSGSSGRSSLCVWVPTDCSAARRELSHPIRRWPPVSPALLGDLYITIFTGALLLSRHSTAGTAGDRLPLRLSNPLNP